MSHRGCSERVWSPDAGVYFGERNWHLPDESSDGHLALDARLYVDPNVDDQVENVRKDIAALLSVGDYDTLAELRGSFALAFWDREKKSLVLAVDHFGLKDLYWCRVESGMAFASEYKALLALTGFNPELDADSIQYHQATRLAMPGRTFLKYVESVDSGSVLRLNPEHVERHCFWSPMVRTVDGSMADFCGALRRQLVEATRKQVAGHDRVGVALSGGIDSSVVAAVLQNLAGDRLTAYSVGYDESDPEIAGARQVSAHLGIDHEVVYMHPKEIRSLLPSLIWLMEECSEREEAVLMMRLIREFGAGRDVMLFGDGADGMLGGMPRHRLVSWAENYPVVRKPLMELYQLTQTGHQPPSILGRSLGWMVYRGNTFGPPAVHGATGGTRVPEPASLNESLATTLAKMSSHRYAEPLAEEQNYDYRSPFLDPDTADLAMSIPSRFKVGLITQKLVLREAFTDLLPSHVLQRPKSLQRMEHNIDLSNILDEMVEDMGAFERIRDRNLISNKYLNDLMRRPDARPYHSEQLHRLWTAISLEIWLRQFVDHSGCFWTFDDWNDRSR